MVRTSRMKLSESALDRVYQLLFEVVAKDKNKDEFLELMQDIFSQTERLVIAKRVVIMYLLINDVPQGDIAHALHASVGTVSRYALYLENKETGVKKIIKRLLKKEKIMYLFDDIFHELFITPGVYKGHWSIYTSYLKRKNKRKTAGL